MIGLVSQNLHICIGLVRGPEGVLWVVWMLDL